MGTLTLSISDSANTSVFPIVLYKSCTMATPKHRDHSYLENYVQIVAFAPVLQRAFFNRVTRFLQHSTTIKLIPLSELIKGPYPALRAPQQ